MCKNRHFDNKHVAAKYLNRYISLNCSAEMQELGLFPNLKEIQESFAFWSMIETHVMLKDPSIKKEDESVHVYVIGDGHVPRTGAVIAFMTKWKVASIDPLMRDEKYKGKIQRLNPVKDMGENISKYLIEGEPSKVFLLFPHSHITNTNEVYKHFKQYNTWLINMPCCYPSQDKCLPLNWCTVYKDVAVNSDKNLMKVYNNYIKLH